MAPKNRKQTKKAVAAKRRYLLKHDLQLNRIINWYAESLDPDDRQALLEMAGSLVQLKERKRRHKIADDRSAGNDIDD